MPVVTVRLMEGYDDATLRRLCTHLTRAVQQTIAAPPEAITVMVDQVAPAGYMRGGESRRPGPARPSASAIVERFLRLHEARRLDEAMALTGEGFRMTFPGDRRFTSLQEQAAAAKGRYQRVSKVFERFDESMTDEGIVVTVLGTLQGAWLDGTPFSGIRFIDRFVLRDGKIVDQRVWNDMGEAIRMAADDQAPE